MQVKGTNHAHNWLHNCKESARVIFLYYITIDVDD
jgi:hypothetical protein